MADENGALNNDAGSSPVPAQAGELVSTVEFLPSQKPAGAGTEPEGAKNTGAAKAGKDKQPNAGKEAGAQDGKTTDEKAGPDEGKPDGEEDRFDKHPRFQELHRRVKESDAVIRELRQTLNDLQARIPVGGDPGGKDGKSPKDSGLPYRDVSAMKPEELLDWQSEDPKGYYQNILAQAKHELSGEFSKSLERRQQEDAIVSTYESFAKANPDFDQMWDEGTLQAFMRSNPGHNAISAYHAITADARVKAAVEKAVKEAESSFVKNQRAKRSADVLPQGPSAPGAYTQGDEALKDSKKFGGTTTVLAQRLADRRRSQAGM